ncbi:MAG: ribokinase [Theionarchaea archaeon]|nr:ribokinase [Theionarchaea archaeon]
MITGIGNPVFDYIRTPLVESQGRILSGCSTNACIVTAQLETDTTMVGCVGGDFRDETERTLSRFGIDPFLFPSRETGGFSLVYDEKGDRELTVLGRADPILEVPDPVLSSDIILLGPILQEISPALVHYLREESTSLLFCDPQGFLRSMDDSRIFHTFPAAFKDSLPLFDFVKPNEPEARTMTGLNASEKPHTVIERLYDYSPTTWIVTLAEKGSLIYDGSELLKIPAFSTTATDPTGAGDTYAGGFMVEYLRSGDLFSAGIFASCTASLWIEKVGPFIEIREEKVRERVEQLEKS